MQAIIIESPYAGEVDRNILYARMAMKDCLQRGEAPLASHLLYTQVLDDSISAERELGIKAGLEWAGGADLAVFYIDYGYSPGMLAAKDFYDKRGIRTEERKLFEG